MTDEVELTAVHVVRISTGEWQATGRTDKDGAPVLRPLFRDIQPGETFDAPRDFAAELLRTGAAALPGSDGALAAEARAVRERG